MTWNEIAQRIFTVLNEASGNSRWDSKALEDLAKAGEVDFISRTSYLRAMAVQDLTAETADFELPSDLIRIISVKAGSVFLQPKSEAELRELYGDDWDTRRGSPLCYRSSGAEISLTPIPSESLADGLTIHYVKAPDPDDENPAISSIYHKALIYYGTFAALLEDQLNKEQAAIYQGLYLREVAEAKKNLRSKDRKSSFRDNLRTDLKAYWRKW